MTLHDIELHLFQQFRDTLHGRIVRLVREHPHPDAAFAYLQEHVDNALIGMGLQVPSHGIHFPETGEASRVGLRITAPFRKNPGDQRGGTIADKIPKCVYRVNRQPTLRKHNVDGVCKVFKRIQERSVQITYDPARFLHQFRQSFKALNSASTFSMGTFA